MLPRHAKVLKRKMQDSTRQLVFIQQFACARRVICVATHKENGKFNVMLRITVLNNVKRKFL